ncbi:MAG: prolipoprotein diacylglyceryl transferase [Dysgonamonadaceae bacterium]|jgi:prolipoprotein diacylglyceryl transferase|nr:prolipoprotein diacylglyceryl transferase [Dysgonamonadaceae bacterium]
MLSYITWTADPTAFHIPFWGHEVRWYGIAFAVGFALGAWIVQKIWKNEKLNESWYDKLFLYVLISATLGARLGHCLFYAWEPLAEPVEWLGITWKYYNPYLAHPIDLIKIWEGGLASHGGTLGIVIAVWIFSRKVTHKSLLWTFDRLVVPVGFVAALIRLGNLMNSEIYGHPTTAAWGFRFVNDRSWHLPPINALPCHPTQLYEAFFYILTGFVCLWMYWKRKDYQYPGLIFGVFLIGIFLSRFFVEFFKNVQESFESNWVLDMGQWLSVPFIIAGIVFIYNGLRVRGKEVKGKR